MSRLNTRGRPYQAGVLNFTNANEVETFVLPNNAKGFSIYERTGTAILKFGVDDSTAGGIIDGVDADAPWADSHLADASNGRYTTVPVGKEGGWRDIVFNEQKTIHVSSNTAATNVEVTIYF